MTTARGNSRPPKRATAKELREALDKLVVASTAVSLYDLGPMPTDEAELERRNELGRANAQARKVLEG